MQVDFGGRVSFDALRNARVKRSRIPSTQIHGRSQSSGFGGTQPVGTLCRKELRN